MEVTKRQHWPVEKIQGALDLVKSGRSVRFAATQLGIPRTTIRSKLSGRSTIDSRAGPKPILGEEEEEYILKWMKHCQDLGFPVSRSQLTSNVKVLLKHMKRKNPFKNGEPGRHWYDAFMTRHPLSERKAQTLTPSRAAVTLEDLRHWFTIQRAYLTKKQMLDIPAKRKFNLDETMVLFVPRIPKVLVTTGSKAVYRKVTNDDKEGVTMLFNLNAEGDLVPTMIVFAYKCVPYSVSQSVPQDWAIGKSDSGWMTGETFFEYIANVFEPWLTRIGIQRPVLLFIDGHKSHLTLAVAEFCVAHQIELIALHPNSTHIMQPLDFGFFKPFKQSYEKENSAWRLTNQRKMRNEDIGTIAKNAVDSMDLKSIMASEFKATGLHPFTETALESNGLLKIHLKKQEIETAKAERSASKSSASSSQSRINSHEFLSQLVVRIGEEQVKLFNEAEARGGWNGIEKYLGL